MMMAALSRAQLGARLQHVTARRAPSGAQVTLTRKHVYILPTQHGLVFGAVLAVMLIGAVNYNSNLGYFLTFLLAGLSFIALFHTYRNLAGLVVRAGRARPAYAGGSAQFSLQLLNARAGGRWAIRVHVRGGHVSLTDVPGTGEVTVVAEVPAPVRGRMALGTITVISDFPLGLFRAWAPLTPDVHCLVYPRPTRPQKKNLGARAGGSGPSLPEAGADDFGGLKEYRPGDPPRHVHWKAAARGQGLLVKVFSAARQPELWLRWGDVTGETETRLRRLCRAVLDADHAGLPYGLDIPGILLAPGRGSTHRRRCLEALALFGTPS